MTEIAGVVRLIGVWPPLPKVRKADPRAAAPKISMIFEAVSPVLFIAWSPMPVLL